MSAEVDEIEYGQRLIVHDAKAIAADLASVHKSLAFTAETIREFGLTDTAEALARLAKMLQRRSVMATGISTIATAAIAKINALHTVTPPLVGDADDVTALNNLATLVGAPALPVVAAPAPSNAPTTNEPAAS